MKERDKKNIILLLRWTAIIVTSYLILLGRGKVPNPNLSYLFVLGYVVSNLVLAFFPSSWFSNPKFFCPLVIADTGVVRLGMYLSEKMVTDFYLVFFLIIIFASLSRNFKLLMVIGGATALLYGFLLYSWGLLISEQGSSYALRIAPVEPGDYQYVCTFPGHWRRMRGTLAVVKDVEAYLASRAAAAPKVTEWKVEELAPDLTSAGASRNAARGKEIFTKLACASCHKLGAEGVNYGPELTDVLKRYNNDRAELLRQIIEPSLVITNRYRNYEFELKDGESVFGMIVKEEGEAWTIQTGPSDALIQTLKKSDVRNQRPQNSSLMPLALLNTLSKEEILDLLAYLETGGNPTPHEHEH